MDKHIKGVFVSSLLLLSLSGCSEQPTRFPVAGKVLIDGEPVPTGSIQFVPEGGRPFASKISSNGAFRLTEATLDKQAKPDGVAPGRYRIGVSSTEVLDEDEGEVIKHIPGRYADFRTSELEMEIDAPKEDLIIELTWEGAEERTDLNPEAEEAAEVEAGNEVEAPEPTDPNGKEAQREE